MAASIRGHPDTEPGLPSLGRQIVNLAGAVAHAGWAAIHGEAVTLPDDAYEARLAVCTRAAGLSPQEIIAGHCDHYRVEDGRCGGMQGCGCFLADRGIIPGKARLAMSDCPLKRWPGSTPA